MEKKKKIKQEKPVSQSKTTVHEPETKQEVVLLDDELPSGWKAFVSKSCSPGKIYYFNSKSGVKSWTKPNLDGTVSTIKKEKTSKTKQRKSRQHTKSHETKKEVPHHAPIKKETVKQETGKDIVPSKFGGTVVVQPKSEEKSVQRKIEEVIVQPKSEKRKSLDSVDSSWTKRMALDDEMIVESPLLLNSNFAAASESACDDKNFAHTPDYGNLNHWLNSHLEDAQIESMDWETSDVPVPCAEVANSAWHVVVDTNVLLGNLEFIHQLRDTQFDNFGLVVVAIPWAVLQELDHFKSERSRKRELQDSARKAISFIHKSFSMSHPRFIGQFSPDQAFKKLKIKNDDAIINYCLILQNDGKRVMLLTEDKNLCNKAMVASLECQSVVSLKQWIALANSEPKQEDKSERKQNIEIAEVVEVPAISIIKSAKSTLVTFLGKVLESEMKAMFSEIWLRVILVKPPWSFEDLMRCYEKHWMAVTSNVFDRPAEALIKSMARAPAFRYNRTWEAMKKNEIREALEMCISLCSSIKPQKYKLSGQQASEKLKALLEQLESGKSCQISESAVPEQVKMSMEEETRKIVFCFDSAWQNLSNFCSEVEKFIAGPYHHHQTKAVETKIMAYYRLMKSILQLNERLIRADGKCEKSDLVEMTYLLLKASSLGDNGTTMDSLSSDALKEFYTVKREELLRAQEFFNESCNTLSRGMSTLMAMSQQSSGL